MSVCCSAPAVAVAVAHIPAASRRGCAKSTVSPARPSVQLVPRPATRKRALVSAGQGGGRAVAQSRAAGSGGEGGVVATSDETSTPLHRRGLLASALALALASGAHPALAEDMTTAEALQEKAVIAFNNRDFAEATEALTGLMELQPGELGWVEGRAQVLLDNKNFEGSMRDYDAALSMAGGDGGAEARLRAGRALAHEGLGNWESALADYDRSLELARDAGFEPDPYVLNSRGNCFASLGRWAEARQAYTASAEGFAGSRLRDRYGSMRPRQQGYVQAASNSALALAELGDREGAIAEIKRLVRREPGSVDMRAALASLYWEEGNQQAAEDQWEFACEKIDAGCLRYKDIDWLSRIRRWPPGMVDRMKSFLAIS